jgi:phosphosulfolactate synthase (CoM biosynthesis protein A)
MRTNTEVSRITIDIPKESHRMLKAKAALVGKSMREIVLEAIEDNLCGHSHVPNKETMKAISDAKKGKGLTRCENPGKVVEECKLSHVPNKRLRKILLNIEAGKNLVEADNLEDLFKKLGI